MGDMAAPLPPMDAMMGGMPVDPAMGAPMPADPMAAMGGGDPLSMLMDALQGKWAGTEAQVIGEKDAVAQMLMGLLAPAPDPAAMFAEGAADPMMGAPMPPMGGPLG